MAPNATVCEIHLQLSYRPYFSFPFISSWEVLPMLSPHNDNSDRITINLFHSRQFIIKFNGRDLFTCSHIKSHIYNYTQIQLIMSCLKSASYSWLGSNFCSMKLWGKCMHNCIYSLARNWTLILILYTGHAFTTIMKEIVTTLQAYALVVINRWVLSSVHMWSKSSYVEQSSTYAHV